MDPFKADFVKKTIESWDAEETEHAFYTLCQWMDAGVMARMLAQTFGPDSESFADKIIDMRKREERRAS